MNRTHFSTVLAIHAVTIGVLMIAVSTAYGTDWPPASDGEYRGIDTGCKKQDPFGNGGSCTHYNLCIARPNDPIINNICVGNDFLKRADFREYGYCRGSTTPIGCVEFPNIICARLAFYPLPDCTGTPCYAWVPIEWACKENFMTGEEG